MSIISFKTAYRSLVKRKGFSMLNMLGLAIGMTSCLLIFHYVSFERSFDNFSNQGDQVVQIGQLSTRYLVMEVCYFLSCNWSNDEKGISRSGRFLSFI